MEGMRQRVRLQEEGARWRVQDGGHEMEGEALRRGCEMEGAREGARGRA